ncbi:3-deoxy-7-phosphoheptulonate synthase [bacterium]|nr:3-deoxy-7-phosphoheptulonate synthase [bacterium]
MEPTQDLNIIEMETLISPNSLKEKLPITTESHRTVIDSREIIKSILRGDDRRLLIVVGPCSIYDPKAAVEYASRLQNLIRELPNLFIVMRGYFEKPRTTVGWKGFINDPFLNGHGDISQGLHLARELLLHITGMGVPIAAEVLDPIVPQYIADLVSWASIGARTTESQTHREMASGLSMPVGYKNSTEGNLDVAINAMQASQHPHHFLGIDPSGHIAIIKTKGNSYGHVILRGGKAPNYDTDSINSAAQKMTAAGFRPAMMVDCSHGNSNKDHRNQSQVARSVVDSIVAGTPHVVGLMLESNLFEGNQKIPSDLSQLKYGISITDACMSWESTDALLRDINQRLST